MPSKTFSVTGGGSQVLMFNGHSRYDAFRVEFNSGNSDDTSTDVTIKVDSETYEDAPDFGSFDATVVSETGLDVSGGDPHVGTEASSRTVAVEVSTASASAEGTVYSHNASDPAQNAAAFANR